VGWCGQMYEIDEKDAQILAELKRNSRLSFRKLARKLNMATTTMINKYNNLKKVGIIKRPTIEVDYEKLGYNLYALIELRIPLDADDAVQKLAKNTHVEAVFDVTGGFDYVILARFRTREELSGFVKYARQLKGVERTNTHIVLETIKNEIS